MLYCILAYVTMQKDVYKRQGLGEYEVIQDIFRQHLQDCIDDLYGKRSPHRPAIPNIK